MKKTTKLSKAAILISVSFAANKLLAIFRQLLIARQFGLSSDLDVFNVANNIPDMLYALISGGALAVAIIPVLTEVIAKENREASWRVFSSIANFAFMITLALSLFVFLFAWPLVQHPLGIAPGFSLDQQALVVHLMRLDLVSTIIFSMAGLLIAGLQANQHFLLPAIGPILYNLGQIFGALVLAPETGLSFGQITLPAYNLGVYGLVYGVLIGSALYFLAQIPGLVIHKFKWTPSINLNNPDVKKILVMLGPRVVSMLMYQLTFIARDNLASRLPLGSVTALTYGWMILQLPETLIGTAIGTAILPTLSEQIAKNQHAKFQETINKVVRILIALSVPSALLLIAGLQPFLSFAFGFDPAGTDLLLWVTRAFLIGLLSHTLLELAARIFFARQNAIVPFIGSAINLAAYIISGIFLTRSFAATGLALADAISFTCQSGFLLIMYYFWLNKSYPELNKNIKFFQRPAFKTTIRTLLGSIVAFFTISFLLKLGGNRLNMLLLGTGAAAIGLLVVIPFIYKEIKLLLRL